MLDCGMVGGGWVTVDGGKVAGGSCIVGYWVVDGQKVNGGWWVGVRCMVEAVLRDGAWWMVGGGKLHCRWWMM